MHTSLVPVHLAYPQPRQPRSPGVHVSSLYTGLFKPEYLEDLSLVDGGQAGWWERLDPVAKLRISMGLAWEEWYLPQLPGVIDHPGELCVDGIFLTPDGESLDVIKVNHTRRFELAMHEVKLTYKSVNKVAVDLSNQVLWVSQTKAYCYATDSLVAYIHPLFVCGDYTYPIRPRLGPIEGKDYCYRIEYTREELVDHWMQLRAYRDSLLEL